MAYICCVKYKQDEEKEYSYGIIRDEYDNPTKAYAHMSEWGNDMYGSGKKFNEFFNPVMIQREELADIVLGHELQVKWQRDRFVLRITSIPNKQQGERLWNIGLPIRPSW